MEDVQVVLEEKPSLRRVRRANVSEEFRTYATHRLVAWWKALLDRMYPDSLALTPKTLMSDTVIDKLPAKASGSHRRLT